MSKFGGGGVKCAICDKTAYPAETINFEKISYHVECFRCSTCDKKMESAGKAAAYDAKIYCHGCFTKGGFAQKQKNVKWTKKEGGGSSSLASKFGGGGNKCTVCTKTVYTAETVSFEKKPYHAECFTCTEPAGDGVCGKKLTPSGANEYDDRIICTKCFSAGGYNRKQAKSAGGSSAKANAIAAKFGGGGNKCVRCTKTVYPAETVSYEKNFFHADCFTCKNCEKKVTPSGAEGKKLEDGGVDVYCKKCWGELGLNRAQVNK